MKQRKLVIGLLIILAVAVSGFTFAFWAGTLTGDDVVASNTVTIGTAEAVTTEVTYTPGGGAGSLVPAGRVENSVEADATASVVFTFTVIWADTVTNDSYDGQEEDLDITISPILIDGVAQPAGLISATPSGDVLISLNDGSANVTVTVVFDREPTQAEYDIIAGGEITFNVTFNVTP